MAKDVIARNGLAGQYICAARKNFIMRSAPDCLSESDSRLVVGHFTDIHGDEVRFRNAMALFGHYRPDFIVHTGDLVKWNGEDDTDFFYRGIQEFPIPVYNCIGNHDTFSDSGQMMREQLYERYIRPLKNICCADRKCYYHADFPEKRMRLVVLNDYDYEDDQCAILQEQCDWLIGTLQEAADREYGVIVAEHEAHDEVDVSGGGRFCQRYVVRPWGAPLPRPLVVPDIVHAFRQGTSLRKDYKWWKVCEEQVHVDCSFSRPGEFICYLNGHAHADLAGYLRSYPDQLTMTMTCSGCLPPAYHNIGEEMSDLPRIPGTVTEDAVNFYIVDRRKRTLTAVRAGAYVNDRLEERLYQVYAYDRKGGGR